MMVKLPQDFTAILTLTILLACSGDNTSGPLASERELVILPAAEDSSIFDRYIPPELRPFLQGATELVSAYKDVTSTIGVVKEIATILGILQRQPTVSEMFARLQNQIKDSIAQVLWRMDALDRSNRLANALAATKTAMQFVGWGMAVPPAAIMLSSQMVEQAMQPIQFERVYSESVTGSSSCSFYTRSRDYLDNPCWKSLLKSAGESTKPPPPMMHRDTVNDREVEVVYDWRLGVPQLMNLISLRINVIAAADREFRMRRSIFAGELLEYKDALRQHMRNMREGVQCASVEVEFEERIIDGIFSLFSYQLWVGCADRYTGASVIERHPVDTQKKRPEFVSIRMATLTGTVMDAMPFAEMEELAGLLEQLANPPKPTFCEREPWEAICR